MLGNTERRSLLFIREDEDRAGETSQAPVKRMLVLSRKVGERILIGDKIAVTIVRIGQGGVRIGIEAPEDYEVIREELKREANEQQQLDSAPTSRLGAPK